MREGKPSSSEEARKRHIEKLKAEKASIQRRLSNIRSEVSEWEFEAQSDNENMSRPFQKVYDFITIQEMRFEILELEERVKEIEAELQSLKSH